MLRIAAVRTSNGVTAVVVGFTLLLTVLGGCSAGPNPIDPPPAQETTSVAPTSTSPGPTESVTASQSPTVQVTTESPDSPSPSEVSPSPSPSKTVLGPEDVGRDLTKADIHSTDPSDLEVVEDEFKVGPNSVRGMGMAVYGCGRDDSVMLEMRLGMVFDKISFDIGQDLTRTDDSDQILVARVEGDDDKFLDSARSELKQRGKIDANVKGVAALRIYLYLDEEKCSYSSQNVYAVLSSMRLE